MEFAIPRSAFPASEVSGPPVSWSEEPTTSTSRSSSTNTEALSAQQIQVIRSTYEQIKGTLDQHALVFFLTIFDLSPDARNLFHYVRESKVPVPVNESLGKHATDSFKMMLEAICKMDDPAEIARITPLFQALGKRHLNYGVDSDDFPVFTTAFLKAMQKALGELWAGEVEESWKAGLDILEGIVTDGMNKKKAETRSS